MTGRVVRLHLAQSRGWVRAAGHDFPFTAADCVEADYEDLYVGSVVEFTITHDGRADEIVLVARPA